MKKNLLLGITELIVALAALPAGLLFILHPDGSALQMPVTLLEGSPFHDYLIPGLFLFTVNGLCQLGAAILSFRRHRLAGHAGLILGILLMSWIVIQVLIIGLNSFLQYTFFIVGFLEVILAWRIIRSPSHVAQT
jgi:hypothetical protein